jgi:hypothetical protein
LNTIFKETFGRLEGLETLFDLIGFKLNKGFHVVYYNFYLVFSRDKFGTLEPSVKFAGYKEAMTIVVEKVYKK